MLEIEKYEAVKAKERQATSTGGTNPQLVALIPQGDEEEKGPADGRAPLRPAYYALTFNLVLTRYLR